ncbi:15312_t:CDS:2 [Funneliformis caledonium]|uniref:15312_t:CDS:1 n=1 Tax=Funneliformis caledonium TaxID=1117310 RepID=A0A9N9B2D5_9GLOM|nr:15312_t:CDS:2 [Funneliformis caledonium]
MKNDEKDPNSQEAAIPKKVNFDNRILITGEERVIQSSNKSKGKGILKMINGPTRSYSVLSVADYALSILAP